VDDIAARFAAATSAFDTPDASPSHSTIGGQMIWL
jgi:hypothetical protein